MSKTNVRIVPQTRNVVVNNERSKVVTVNARGPRGIQGPTGPPGPTGSGVFEYVSDLDIYRSDVGALQVTGSLSSTLFIGDGSGLVNIPSSSVVDLEQTIQGLTFPYIGNAIITGSLTVTPANNNTDDILIIKSGSFEALAVNKQGVVRLGEHQDLPTPVAGGLVYHSSSFWIGV